MNIPMSREEMLRQGGQRVNPKDPNSPILMPFSPQALTGSRLFLAEYQGLLGKGPQGAAEYQGQLDQAVAEGIMSPAERNGLMRQFLSDQATGGRQEPSGTWREIYYDKKDPDTGKVTNEIMEENSVTGQIRDFKTGRIYSRQELTQAGYTKTDKPPAERPTFRKVAAGDKLFQDYMKENYPQYDLTQFDSNQQFEIARSPVTGKFQGAPTMLPLTAAAERSMLGMQTRAYKDSTQVFDPATKQYRDITDKEAASLAGKDVLRYRDLVNERMEQGMNINAFRSGVPIQGRELPPGFRLKPGLGDVVMPQPDTTAPPAEGTVTIQPPPPGGYTIAGDQARGRGPGGLPTEQDYLDAYMSWVGGGTAGGRDDWVKRGRQAIIQKTGWNAAQLGAAETEWRGLAATDKLVTGQRAAMERYVDMIDKFAGQWFEAMRKLPDHGSQFFNELARDVVQRFKDNPDLPSAQLAGTAMARVYGGLVSNAYLSKAQIEAGALKTSLDSFKPTYTIRDVSELMSRVRLESQTERWGFDKSKWNIQRDYSQSALGKALGMDKTLGPAPVAPPTSPPGKMPLDGQTRQIRVGGKVVNARWDAAQSKWVQQ